MGLVLQNIASELFSKSLVHEYRLSLLVGIDGISYLVVDSLDNVVLFKRFKLRNDKVIRDMKSIFSGDEHLHYNYKSIKVGIDSNHFTLIPKRLFDAEDMELYLQKSTNTRFPLKKEESVDYYADQIIFNQSQLAYAVRKDMLAVLKNYFPSGRMFHSSTAMLIGWQKQSELKEGNKVYLYVDGNAFTAAFFDNAQLIYVNRFRYRTSGDFLYFVLMIYNRFDLKPENVPCIISGQIMEDSEIHKQLYKYIRHIQFSPAAPYYDFNSGFQMLRNHNQFTLFSLKLCE